jgi:hypothetical protein
MILVLAAAAVSVGEAQQVSALGEGGAERLAAGVGFLSGRFTLILAEGLVDACRHVQRRVDPAAGDAKDRFLL